MLGIHDLPKSAPGIAPRGRAATRSLLAMTMASVAFFAMANAAQAKEDCVGGFRMIKDEIPIACGAAAEESAFAPAAPLPSEPATTGSINSVEPPAVRIDEPPAMSPGGMKCVGGYSWRPGVENSYTTLPMPCNRM